MALPTALVDTFSSTANGRNTQVVTLTDGRVIVAWSERGPDGRFTVFADLFSTAGDLFGSKFALALGLTSAVFDLGSVGGNGIVVTGIGAAGLVVNAAVLGDDGDAIGADLVFSGTVAGTSLAASRSPVVAGGTAQDFALFHDQRVTIGGQIIVNVVMTTFRDGTPSSRAVAQGTVTTDVEIAVTQLTNGNFVLVQGADRAVNGGTALTVRLLDRDGQPLIQNATNQSGAVVMAFQGNGRITEPAVAALAGGGFVVAGVTNDGDIDIVFQVFDATGKPLSQLREMGVEQTPGASDNNEPVIVPLDDGTFFIFYDKDDSVREIRGQRFDAEGRQAGRDIVVFGARNAFDLDATALPDGRIAVSFVPQGQNVIQTQILQVGDLDLVGTAAGETLVGTDFDDRILGLGGTDVLKGGKGDDELVGNDGNDTLDGGAGADILSGGVGIDTADYSGSATGLTVNLDNRAQNTGDAAGDTHISIESIRGTAFNDRLTGNGLSNVLSGGNGTDTLAGGDGNDTLDGGRGADNLSGGNGLDTASYDTSTAAVRAKLANPTSNLGDARGDTYASIEGLIGSAFNDTLTGDAGANAISGGGGNDTILGGAGADTLAGGAGIDTVSYAGSSAGVTVVLANATAFGGDAQGDVLSGFENLIGSAFDDLLIGNSGANRLIGGAGNDFLAGFSVGSTILGGAGNDTIAVFSESFFSGSTFDGGKGMDTLRLEDSNSFGTSTISSIETLLLDRDRQGDFNEAGFFANQFKFTTVEKAGGDPGSRISILMDTQSVLDLSGIALIGDGVAGLSFRVEGDDQSETITGTALADTILGGGGNDTLIGGAGNDNLNGGLGADRMIGGAGNDTYAVDSASDQVFETTTATSNIDAGGLDTVQSSVTFNLSTAAGARFVETLMLTGTAAINGIGSGLDNQLVGNSGDNVLNGLGGNDTMTGGAGADTFSFRSVLSAGNVDTIVDFNVVEDSIRLDDAIFANIARGVLAAGAFASNLTGLARDLDDRIIYESDTGRLFFDANGSAAGGGVHFASLTAGLALTNADFIVV